LKTEILQDHKLVFCFLSFEIENGLACNVRIVLWMFVTGKDEEVDIYLQSC